MNMRILCTDAVVVLWLLGVFVVCWWFVFGWFCLVGFVCCVLLFHGLSHSLLPSHKRCEALPLSQ